MGETGVENVLAANHAAAFLTNGNTCQKLLEGILPEQVRKKSKILVVHDQPDREGAEEMYSAALAPVAELLLEGQLKVWSAQDVYLREGQLNLETLLFVLEKEERKARSEGFGGFFFLLELTPVLLKQYHSAHFDEFLHSLHSFFASSNRKGLFLYHVKQLDSESVWPAFSAHPVIFFQEQTVENPFFLSSTEKPFEIFLKNLSLVPHFEKKMETLLLENRKLAERFEGQNEQLEQLSGKITQLLGENGTLKSQLEEKEHALAQTQGDHQQDTQTIDELEKKNQLLEEQTRRARESLESLKQNHQNAMQKLQEKMDENQALQKHLEQAHTSLRQSQQQLAQLEETTQVLSRQQVVSREKNIALQNEHKSLQDRLVETQAQAQQKEEGLQQLQNSHRNVLRELARQKEVLQSLREENQQLQQDKHLLSEIRQAHQKNQEELHITEKHLEENRQKNLSLSSELRLLQEQKKKWLEESTRLHLQIQKHEEFQAQQEETFRAQQQQSDALEQQLHDLQHEVSQAKQEREATEKLKASLRESETQALSQEQKIQSLSWKIEHLAAKEQQLQNRIQELEKQNAQLQNLHASDSDTRQILERERDDLLQTLSQKETDHAKFKAMREEQETRTAHLQTQLSTQNLQLENLKNQNHLLQKKIHQVEEQAAQDASEREHVHRKWEEAENKVKGLRGNLEEYKLLLQERERKIEQLEHQEQVYAQKQLDLAHQVNAMEQSQNEVLKEKDSLRQQLREMEQRLQLLHEELIFHRKQVSLFQEQRATWLKRLLQQEKAKRRLEITIHKQNAQFRKNSAFFVSLQADLQHRVQAGEARTLQLQQKLEKSNEEKEKLQREAKNACTKLEEMHARLQQSQTTAQQESERIQQLHEEKNHLQQLVASLDHQISEKNARINQLLSTLQKGNEQGSQEHPAAQPSPEMDPSEIAVLKTLLKEAEQQLSGKERALERAQKELLWLRRQRT